MLSEFDLIEILKQELEFEIQSNQIPGTRTLSKEKFASI